MAEAEQAHSACQAQVGATAAWLLALVAVSLLVPTAAVAAHAE